jgi:allophanate hydrolase subunit 2
MVKEPGKVTRIHTPGGPTIPQKKQAIFLMWQMWSKKVHAESGVSLSDEMSWAAHKFAEYLLDNMEQFEWLEAHVKPPETKA